MTDETSTAPDQLLYVVEQLQSRIDSFHKSVKWYRLRFYAATMAAAIISAVITVLAGWKPAPSMATSVNNIILTLSALATVVSVWGAFFSPRESWLTYASSLHRLRALKDKIDFQKIEWRPGALPEAQVKTFFDEYQEILSAHNAARLAVRYSRAGEGKQP
jgi:hypothetical protein